MRPGDASFEVLVSQPPTVDLSPIGDDCETTVLTPVVAYTHRQAISSR
ncbi:MAG: hypothetical protein IPH04_19855 [Saprospirales bacterium]|nr:hypothetical protein [Saprospirales bacterium]